MNLIYLIHEWIRDTISAPTQIYKHKNVEKILEHDTLDVLSYVRYLLINHETSGGWNTLILTDQILKKLEPNFKIPVEIRGRFSEIKDFMLPRINDYLEEHK